MKITTRRSLRSHAAAAALAFTLVWGGVWLAAPMFRDTRPPTPVVQMQRADHPRCFSPGVVPEEDWGVCPDSPRPGGVDI